MRDATLWMSSGITHATVKHKPHCSKQEQLVGEQQRLWDSFWAQLTEMDTNWSEPRWKWNDDVHVCPSWVKHEWFFHGAIFSFISALQIVLPLSSDDDPHIISAEKNILANAHHVRNPFCSEKHRVLRHEITFLTFHIFTVRHCKGWTGFFEKTAVWRQEKGQSEVSSKGSAEITVS